jgi:hypothetical protein
VPTPSRLVRLALATLLLLALAACGSDTKVLVIPPPIPPEPAEEPEPEPEPQPEPEPEPEPGPPSPLTGLEVDEEVLDLPALLVKVDNAPQARPQSGLDVADLVYEEVVEAGVTRFLAVFHSALPPVAGPVRSARPVDVQLMSGYGRSGFFYSGARDEVQPLLRNAPAIVITEGGPGFFRDRSRRAPHNLYIDAPAARQGARELGATPLEDVAWVFDEEAPAGALSCPDDADGCDDPGAGIQIRMSSGFRTAWEYDEEAGLYRRFQNGSPFYVTGEGRVGAANVVVLDTRHYLGTPSCYGSPCPETDVVTDDAAALVLRDGQRFEARYRKPSADAPLEVLTPDGQPFPLKPGRTWLHLPDTLPSISE